MCTTLLFEWPPGGNDNPPNPFMLHHRQSTQTRQILHTQKNETEQCIMGKIRSFLFCWASLKCYGVIIEVTETGNLQFFAICLFLFFRPLNCCCKNGIHKSCVSLHQPVVRLLKSGKLKSSIYLKFNNT